MEALRNWEELERIISRALITSLPQPPSPTQTLQHLPQEGPLWREGTGAGLHWLLPWKGWGLLGQAEVPLGLCPWLGSLLV